jgi:hypothetical protein
MRNQKVRDYEMTGNSAIEEPQAISRILRKQSPTFQEGDNASRERQYLA